MSLQIRLNQDTRLGDLAKDLIAGFETVLRYNKQPLRWGHREKTKLIRIIRNRLSKNVSAYAACGLRNRCHTVEELAEIRIEARRPQKTRRILLLKQTLPYATLELEAAVFDRYYPGAADKIWLAMKPELDQVVADVLGPYLYQNPHCDGCTLCTYETRLSPWSLMPTVEFKRK